MYQSWTKKELEPVQIQFNLAEQNDKGTTRLAAM